MFTTNGGPGGERKFATYSCVGHAKTKFIDQDWGMGITILFKKNTIPMQTTFLVHK
jgi:hypothetical protein